MQRARLHGEFRHIAQMRDAQPRLAHGFNMLRPGVNEGHILPRLDHMRAGVTANRTRTENRYSWLHRVSPLQAGAMLRPESRDGKRGSGVRANGLLNRQRPFQSAPPGSSIHHHRAQPLTRSDKSPLFRF